MKPLTHPDNLHLQAAQGWLELGNHFEADKELDEIKPEFRTRPDVLLVRCEIYLEAEKWDGVVAVSDTLVKMIPAEPRLWIHRSFALHNLKRTEEAFDKLLPVVDEFPSICTIPYNLACYCAQLGRLDECELWFKRAMAVDEDTVKREAIDDPDLKPLWDSMSGSMWKRE